MAHTLTVPIFLTHITASAQSEHQKVGKTLLYLNSPAAALFSSDLKFYLFALLAYSSHEESVDNFVVKVYPRYL